MNAPGMERRTLPRPKPEHLRALVVDLKDARANLASADQATRANAVLALALVTRKLENYADAMVSR